MSDNALSALTIIIVFSYFAITLGIGAWRDRGVAQAEAEKAKALNGKDDAR